MPRMSRFKTSTSEERKEDAPEVEGHGRRLPASEDAPEVEGHGRRLPASEDAPEENGT